MITSCLSPHLSPPSLTLIITGRKNKKTLADTYNSYLLLYLQANRHYLNVNNEHDETRALSNLRSQVSLILCIFIIFSSDILFRPLVSDSICEDRDRHRRTPVRVGLKYYHRQSGPLSEANISEVKYKIDANIEQIVSLYHYHYCIDYDNFKCYESKWKILEQLINHFPEPLIVFCIERQQQHVFRN